ncbi:MAG TPA: site-specific integrase [Myxococcota bacterium]|nr:site-specific integrase [Myxococcota bacterium]
MASIYKRGNQYWLLFRFEGNLHREPAGSYKKDAEALLSKRKVEIREGRFFDIKLQCKLTLAGFAPRFLKWAKQHKRSWRRDELSMRNLCAFRLGALRLDKITLPDVEDYARTRLAGGLVFPVGKGRPGKVPSPPTINRELRCLSKALNLAVDLGVLAENPLKGKLKMLAEPEGRVRYLEPVEIKRLLDACADHVRPVVYLGVLTGMRRSEITGLQWAEVNLPCGVICLPGKRTKNRRSRNVPLSAEARAVLREQQRGNVNASPHVFHKPDGSPLGDIKTAFNAACRRAGIEDFHFHDLRHCFGSALAMRGVPLQAIGELLGHRTLAMTQRYSHLSPQMLMGAVEQAARYLGTEPTTEPAPLAVIRSAG